MSGYSETDRIANWMKRYGLQDIAALVIDVAGPFRYLGAQVMYVFQPFFGAGVNFARDLAVILEDGNKVESLLFKLREVSDHDD
jgi:hypothetical protein